VVQVGRQGVTDSVLKEIGHALQAHELIKVKVSPDCPVPIAETQQPIEAGTQSQIVQIIGHMLVVYRRRSESPKVEPFRKKDAKKTIVKKRNSLKARRARSPKKGRRRSR
jgi:RNA-binding protein